jgi:hypothetical protein
VGLSFEYVIKLMCFPYAEDNLPLDKRVMKRIGKWDEIRMEKLPLGYIEWSMEMYPDARSFRLALRAIKSSAKKRTFVVLGSVVECYLFANEDNDGKDQDNFVEMENIIPKVFTKYLLDPEMFKSFHSTIL